MAEECVSGTDQVTGGAGVVGGTEATLTPLLHSLPAVANPNHKD